METPLEEDRRRGAGANASGEASKPLRGRSWNAEPLLVCARILTEIPDSGRCPVPRRLRHRSRTFPPCRNAPNHVPRAPAPGAPDQVPRSPASRSPAPPPPGGISATGRPAPPRGAGTSCQPDAGPARYLRLARHGPISREGPCSNRCSRFSRRIRWPRAARRWPSSACRHVAARGAGQARRVGEAFLRDDADRRQPRRDHVPRTGRVHGQPRRAAPAQQLHRAHGPRAKLLVPEPARRAAAGRAAGAAILSRRRLSPVRPRRPPHVDEARGPGGRLDHREDHAVDVRPRTSDRWRRSSTPRWTTASSAN